MTRKRRMLPTTLRCFTRAAVVWSFESDAAGGEAMAETLQLAQVNIGRVKGPPDSAVMAGFMARLDEINALAERSPGFVWRLQTPAGNATDLRPYDDDSILINMSVWESLEALRAYVFESS